MPRPTSRIQTACPPRTYRQLLDLVEDPVLGRLADARRADGQERVRVSRDAR